MSGEVQFGKCDICKKQTIVESKFYYYGFKCDCHSPEHFERVNYCKDCVPKKPTYTKATLTNEQAQFIAKAVEFYQKNSIKHGHWIERECLITCSACFMDWDKHSNCYEIFHYCPYCGARMDGAENES